MLAAMLETIRHRGPDGHGVETGQGYALGHVRLSILDTSDAASQPMWCPQKRYVLVYNGEIYNYRNLRSILEGKGYKFRSSGDTEVLLYALIEWGKECFKRLEGMFAGIFYDTDSGNSLIFRDHLGIKPLYYVSHEGSFVFASEVKALAPVIGHFSLNRDAVFEHFNFRYVAGERTLFDGIKRLLPGHYIEMDADGRNRMGGYYNVTESLHQPSPSQANTGVIEEALKTSIQAHTISDVGYSIQLSGGIDSSYITTVLSREKERLDTYSISLPGCPEDEREYQKQVVEECGTRHHDYPCDGKKFADLLPEVTRHLDFPVVHGGTVFLYELCRHIGTKHKVVLTGEGADELFLGYSRYNISAACRIAFWLKMHGIKPEIIPDLPKFRAIKRLMKHDLGLDTGVFHSDMTDKMLTIKGDIAYRRETAECFPTLEKRMIASDQLAYLGSMLERQDKISMAHGVEVRVPFCNHRLFDMINPLPFKTKTRPVPKALLKTLMLKDYPQSFVYRTKNGFRLPFDEWLRDEALLGRYLDLVNGQACKDRGLYNFEVLGKMVDNHRSGRHNYGQELFGIATFEIWCREYGM